MSGHEVTATPYLTAHNAASALEFYKRAFGAVEVLRLPDDDGKVSHAEIRIGAARIFVSDEYPDIEVLSPQVLGGTTAAIVLEVADADVVFAQAVAAGATALQPVQDQGGARGGKLRDPFGHRWLIRSANEAPQPAQAQQQ